MDEAAGWQKETKEVKKAEEEEEQEEDWVMVKGDKDDDEDDDVEKDERMEFVLDLDVVREGFTAGVNNEVPIPSYIKAYCELNKFIKLLGALFHFVAFDVKRKVKILRRELAGEEGHHYSDLRNMLKYEKEMNLIHRSSPISASDAFLQLHRGLAFARDFMKELLKDDEEAPPLGHVASQIYLDTTGRFHPTILAKTFSGVLLLMPDRATIRSRVAKDNEEREDTLKRLIPGVIQAVTETYDACEALYKHYDLLSLDGIDGKTKNQK